MHILAIDYGSKRIGLAWADLQLEIVLPFGLIQSKGENEISQQLLDIIKEDHIDLIILGLPYSLKSVTEETPHMKKIRKFGALLYNKTGVLVEYMDERFTSQQADHTPGDVSRDEKSAMIILESYLFQQKNKK